jgi:glycosyltransferase involved in cell wall biosynthesis
MTNGLSVIICCHNGASRLPETLTHLKLQQSPAASWEVLLIDNGSTDDTAKVALSCWADGPAPFRVVREAKLGLQHARARGLREAECEFLGFVDDDNWVAPDWVLTANQVLAGDPALGAVGSICEPVFELPEPEWFSEFHPSYAILTAADLDQCKRPPEYLHGAGLCVRKQAWVQLIQGGFRSLLTGRVGRSLSGGEDTELTLAIRLAGWKIRIEQRLRLQHFMPSQRLQWKYLRKLLRNYCASQVLLDAYSEHSLSLRPGFRRWLSDRWWYQFGKCLTRMESRPSAVMAALLSDGEGREDVIEIEKQFGRALGLLQFSERYSALRCEVRDAVWRNTAAFGRDDSASMRECKHSGCC